MKSEDSQSKTMVFNKGFVIPEDASLVVTIIGGSDWHLVGTVPTMLNIFLSVEQPHMRIFQYPVRFLNVSVHLFLIV